MRKPKYLVDACINDHGVLYDASHCVEHKHHTNLREALKEARYVRNFIGRDAYVRVIECDMDEDYRCINLIREIIV